MGEQERYVIDEPRETVENKSRMSVLVKKDDLVILHEVDEPEGKDEGDMKEPGTTAGKCPEGGVTELQTITSDVGGGAMMGDRSDHEEIVENVHITFFRFTICR